MPEQKSILYHTPFVYHSFLVLVFADFCQPIALHAVIHIEEDNPLYEEIRETVAIRCKSRYVNLNVDGTLDLPPHLRDVFIDFEQLYDNLRYQRLQGIEPRRRSLSGAVDEQGRPTYDVLTRSIFVTPHQVAMVPRSRPIIDEIHQPGQNCESSRKRSKSVDLGQVNALAGALKLLEKNQTDRNSFISK